jgi:hypothetical protein
MIKKLTINKTLAALAISAISQSAAAGISVNVSSTNLDDDIARKSLQYLQEQNPTRQIGESLDLLLDNVRVDGKQLSIRRELLAQNDDSTDAGAASSCYNNCYSDCYSNCHGSRGWR